ncbi:MAG: hypothetical protein BWY24_00625 [Microgenomates group bacterium ADurb.Bin219]|nr:MAG: hypothetical protein BWY24_00625 [Microgenomates group bacterium ADurb.Bin219]
MKTDLKINSLSKMESGSEIGWLAGTGDKITFCLVISYLVIAILATVLGLAFGHTEKSEWLIYEIGAVIIFVSIAMLGQLKKNPSAGRLNRIIKASPAIGLGLAMNHLVFLFFYFKAINFGHLVLLFVGLIPVVFLYRKKPSVLIQSALAIGVLLFCVEGYLFEFLAKFKIREYLLVILSWLVLSLSLILIKKSRFKIPSLYRRLISFATFLLIVLIAFNSTRKTIDYWHYSFFIGPAYDLSLGKNLLKEIPSMYGYLSIHFIELVMRPFGLNFENFHFLNINLFFLYYLGFYFAYKKIFKDNLLVLLFSLVTTFLSTRFYVSEVRGLPPSWGPLRHGFGLLIILALLYLPEKVNYWLISFLAGMTVFWSPEVAVYVVPAFLFTCLVKAIGREQKFFKSLSSLMTELVPFAIMTAGIFLSIVAFELRRYGEFPKFSNYFQFASLFRNGLVTKLIPLFGNYYLPLLVMVIGLCLVFFQEGGRQKNTLLLPLSFLAIYNVAIFSYFVTTSISVTVNNISCFVLLELAIIFQYFRKDENFWSRIFLPATLFLTVFFTVCLWNFLQVIPEKEDPHYSQVKTLLNDYQTIKKTYNLTSENVLVLSKFYDTLIVTENKIKTIWPVNPSAGTILVPNYIEKYLAPNLNQVKKGTILVYTEDLPPEFSEFLNSHYIFEEINPQKRINIFRVYNFWPR